MASADEIPTSSSGTTLGRSSREPKYKIEYHPAKSPFQPFCHSQNFNVKTCRWKEKMGWQKRKHSYTVSFFWMTSNMLNQCTKCNARTIKDDGLESIPMSNKDGQNYVCFLPTVEQTKTVKSRSQQNSSSIIFETYQRIKLKTPDEILDVLKDKCFYRHEGWWSYEFCHLKHLRQLHLEDGKAVQKFYLGQFDPETTAEFNQNHSDTLMLKDPRSKDAAQRYHAHQFTNGTVCDLTNRPRETEVRFVCSEPAVVISSIKEISTCKYVVTVQCPMLCNHLMFQEERPMWHTIHCNEMPGDVKDSSTEDRNRGRQITLVADDSDRYAT